MWRRGGEEIIENSDNRAEFIKNNNGGNLNIWQQGNHLGWWKGLAEVNASEYKYVFSFLWKTSVLGQRRMAGGREFQSFGTVLEKTVHTQRSPADGTETEKCVIRRPRLSGSLVWAQESCNNSVLLINYSPIDVLNWRFIFSCIHAIFTLWFQSSYVKMTRIVSCFHIVGLHHC